VLVCCPSLYEYCMSPTHFKDYLNRRYFHLSAAHRVSDSNISVAIPSSLSLKVSLMDVDSEIYEGWLHNIHN